VGVVQRGSPLRNGGAERNFRFGAMAESLLFRGRFDDDRLVRCLGLLPVTVLFLDGEQFFAATALYGGEGRHGEMRVSALARCY
jgi:hypothetical protein